MRQRYPIIPVHGEGSAVWKELEAMKDLLMNSQTYFYMYREPLLGHGVFPSEPAVSTSLPEPRTGVDAMIGPITSHT